METKQSSFTPGPWAIDRQHHHGTKHHTTFVRSGDMAVCCVTESTIDDRTPTTEAAAANARLIAAAPNLLAALKMFLALMDLAAPAIKDEPEYKAARAAIALAE